MQVSSPEPCQLAAAPGHDVHAEEPDLFSLVFSSGTSGRLKCLKISRRGTEAVVASFGRDFRFRPDDSILAFLPLSSFQQRWMLYAAIHYGFNFSLSVASRLFQALRDMRPTVIGAAPLLYETIEARYQALPASKRRALDVARALLGCMPEVVRRRLARRIFRQVHEVFGCNIRFAIAGAAPIRIKTLRFFASIGMPLYSAYGLTEVGFLSWNVPGKVRLGSVGKEVYPGSLEVAADGEILFSHPDLLSYGYLEVDPEEERKTFLSPSRVATGDIGHFDARGFLYIDGRKKDIIITPGGYKIQPEDLERVIEENAKVGRAVVFGGEDMVGVTALVSLPEGSDQGLQTVVEADIDALNRRLPRPSRITKVVFTSQQFTMDSGLLNHNLKVDRRKVLQRFRGELAPAARMMYK